MGQLLLFSGGSVSPPPPPPPSPATSLFLPWIIPLWQGDATIQSPGVLVPQWLILMGGDQVEQFPVGLLEAIRLAVQKSTNFQERFPGGAWFGQAPEQSILPYVVFREVTSVPMWMTGPGYFEIETASACIWTEDNTGLKLLGLWLESWLNRKVLMRDDGLTTTIQRKFSRQAMEPMRGQDNSIKYYYCVDFDAYTSKVM